MLQCTVAVTHAIHINFQLIRVLLLLLLLKIPVVQITLLCRIPIGASQCIAWDMLGHWVCKAFQEKPQETPWPNPRPFANSTGWSTGWLWPSSHFQSSLSHDDFNIGKLLVHCAGWASTLPNGSWRQLIDYFPFLLEVGIPVASSSYSATLFGRAKTCKTNIKNTLSIHLCTILCKILYMQSTQTKEPKAISKANKLIFSASQLRPWPARPCARSETSPVGTEGPAATMVWWGKRLLQRSPAFFHTFGFNTFQLNGSATKSLYKSI